MQPIDKPPLTALSPPSAARRAANSSRPRPAAEPSSGPAPHARETAVALYPRPPSVVIAPEHTVISGPRALFKSRISKALLWRHLSRSKALRPAGESRTMCKTAGYFAIGVGNA